MNLEEDNKFLILVVSLSRVYGVKQQSLYTGESLESSGYIREGENKLKNVKKEQMRLLMLDNLLN